MSGYDLNGRNQKPDRQKEMTYILYMFMGSYFNKCECKSRIMENSLLLYYKEMPRERQLRAEDKAIYVIEKVLENRGVDFSDLNCEAAIARSGQDYQIFFRTWFEDVTIVVRKDGKFYIDIHNAGDRRGKVA